MKLPDQGALAQGLTDELLAVVHKYDESMYLPTVLGVLEIVKFQLMAEHVDDEEEDR